MGSSFRFHVKILFIIMCGLGTGCMKKDGVSDNYEIVLKINGSSTIGTRLIPALAGLFLSEMGAKNINMIRDKSSSDNVVVGSFGKYSKAISIRNNGSVMGMEDLDNGLCDLCMSFESVIDQNKSAGMQQKVIGYDAMVMIVNRDNPINALDLNKLGDIFSGSVTSWSQFDVDDFSEVTLYMSEHTKLEIEYFKEIFLQDRILTSRFVYCKDDLEIASKVEHDKNGIGFVSMAFAGQNKVLAIKKGAEFFWHPEKFNISSMDYPFTRRLSLFSGQTSGTIADKFLQTAFSWNGRNITEDAGFIVSVCYADSSELSSKWEDFEKEAGSSRRISVSFRFVKESSELDSQSVFDL
ncbi:MAG TPA: substrate-binding domain-containing protein, partial [Chitinispirillaceae bacterium]|nr:substrate-binding domain-containing protein [Chitinispirillaceae bacterium]